ncbi:MAG: hypothetical protein IRZ29_04465 [Thermoflavifilum sp.]|nr:hypothetical protein [Thermoflavifilum sp.]
MRWLKTAWHILFFCGCLGLNLQAVAQVYGNEWIDYPKTYYKFKIAQEGVYRIPYDVLAQQGLDKVPVYAFQLWHQGRQVPLFVASSGNTLSPGDYLEFIGEPNDGTADSLLYEQAADQLSTHYSLFTDSAAYYLTVDSNAVNARYISMNNDIGSSPPAPLPYFWYTWGYYPRSQINPGYAQVVSGEYIYSSKFDAGEGFSSGYIYPSSKFSVSLNNLNPYTGGPPAVLKVNMAGAAPNNRNVRITLQGQSLLDTALNGFQVAHLQLNQINLSTLSNGASLAVINESTTGTDRVVVGSIELSYPHVFSFQNASYFHFQLPASSKPVHRAAISKSLMRWRAAA